MSDEMLSQTNEGSSEKTEPESGACVGTSGDFSSLSKEEEAELVELSGKFENITINKLKNKQRKELSDFQNEWKRKLKSCKKGEKRTLQREKKSKENEMRTLHKKEINSFEHYNNLMSKQAGPTIEDLEKQKEEIEYKLRMKFFYDKKREKQEKIDKMKKMNNNNNNSGDKSDFENMSEAETKLLKNVLSSLEFDIYDIASDGHCLFRAIEHQLSLILKKNESNASNASNNESKNDDYNDCNEGNESNENINFFKFNHLQLRQLCRDFMMDNPNLFLPFFINDAGDLMNQDDYKNYCNGLICDAPVMWGGHNEIVALSRALNVPIIIHAAYNRPQIVFHKEHSRLDSYWHNKYDTIHEKLKKLEKIEKLNDDKIDKIDKIDSKDETINTKDGKDGKLEEQGHDADDVMHNDDSTTENTSNQSEERKETNEMNELNEPDESVANMVAIHLSYHESQYTLGEHYNSVVPIEYMTNLKKKLDAKKGQWHTVGGSKSKSKR